MITEEKTELYGERELFEARRKTEYVLGLLPHALKNEICRRFGKRRDYPLCLSEIRVRSSGPCILVLSGENVRLMTRVDKRELDMLCDGILGGSLYAHSRELASGYVSIGYGIRVGICPTRLDERSSGMDIGALVFRIPTARSENAERLYSAWNRYGRRGMLIYAPPGAGKTTALRALATLIGKNANVRVAVVDERSEFFASDYSEGSVDIISGYSKRDGLEIAIRTLCPEVILFDEIGSLEEANTLISVGRGGVPIIATAHAEDYYEAVSKPSVAALCGAGFFKLFAGLCRSGAKFLCDIRNSDGDTV